MMLDNGTVVYLWFGKNSSEMEKKLSLKSVQVHDHILYAYVHIHAD